MKVLFFVNGLGLGNSTRCHAIIQHLYSSGAHIEIVTSGNGLWYFSDTPEVSATYEIESLAYGSKDGTINISRTFASISRMAGVFFRNARSIGTLLDKVRPDVIVTDSDYNFLPAKRRNIPIVALNNADIVWHSYFQFENPPSSIRAQFYGVEMLDYRFHQVVPNLVLSPCLDTSMKQSGGNILRIGPIVRKKFDAPLKTTPAQNAVVMLSGSVFGTPVNFSRPSYPVRIDVVGRESPKGWKGGSGVCFHGKIKNTFPILKDVDVAVINGGFSAVSEMVWMKKPVVVVPVPGHAEQWVNAQTIEKLGLGLVASQSNYEEVMLEVVDRVDEFRTGYEKLGILDNGAAQAARAILDISDRKI